MKSTKKIDAIVFYSSGDIKPKKFLNHEEVNQWAKFTKFNGCVMKNLGTRKVIIYSSEP